MLHKDLKLKKNSFFKSVIFFLLLTSYVMRHEKKKKKNTIHIKFYLHMYNVHHGLIYSTYN